VAIPADHHALKASDPSAARQWREATTGAFGECFDQGLVATWFDRGVGYVFERAEKLS
jgi:predicted GNAT superfamily acetyltransferase